MDERGYSGIPELDVEVTQNETMKNMKIERTLIPSLPKQKFVE